MILIKGGAEVKQKKDSNVTDDTTTNVHEQETLQIPLFPGPSAQVEPNRSIRERKPSNEYNPNDYLLLIYGGEPDS